MGKVDLLAGQVQGARCTVKHGVIAGFAGLGEREQVAQEAFAPQQGSIQFQQQGRNMRLRFARDEWKWLNRAQPADSAGLAAD